MNIKNSEAHSLAQRIAQISGESITQAVTQSLRERLERLENPCRRKKVIKRIMSETAPILSAKMMSEEDLFDQNGMPN